MNETCDRCGLAVGAAYRVERDGELYLCGHCTSRLRKALSAQGWTIWPVSGSALVPRLTRQLPPTVPDHHGLHL
jgi:hypothetical protein